MDLQAADNLNRNASRLTKIAAYVCFAIAAGLLVASLVMPGAARAGLNGPAAAKLTVVAR